MRTKNAFKNMISTLISHFASMILSFITQAIFVRMLGTEYLGINGLFNNIISMLGIVELGIGSAIIYNLYKPIAENDVEEIKSLMQFYKKSYRIIALIITVLSLIIIPFLNLIVGETTIDQGSILLIYLLFIIDIICSYLLTYKRSILYANQKNYIIDIIHILYLIILNIVQVIILFKTKNYILFLSFKIFMRLLENIVITVIANRKYNYLLDKNYSKLDDKILKSIIKKVKGLFVHKLGVFFVAGTDNIIISSFLGVSYVGLYSNYYMIINAIDTIVNQIFSAFKASIGNLLVTSDVKKTEIVFKRLQFMNFCFALLSTIGIFIVMDSFIKVWVGEQYVLSKEILIVLSINNYVYLTKLCASNFKEAAGIFYEDRYIPMLESVINIVASIVFLKLFGLAGVFMGTICSNLITHIYTYPKFIYERLLKKEKKEYYIDTGKYALITLILAIITYFISNLFIINNAIIQVIINVILAISVPSTFIIIIFHKKEEFKYYKDMILNVITRRIKKGRREN